jgi:light-regulated signal transduction histidine kinase (bacteriophytochrome)
VTSPVREMRHDPEATIQLLQDELASTNREVMALTIDLEERVAARTTQLSQAIDALRREIAERTRIEKEVRELNRDLALRAAQLEAANEDLEAFSYSVSHDLRAPLVQIDGFAQLLREHAAGALDGEGAGYLDNIRKSAKRMSALINDLLRFARLAKVELSGTKIDLNEMVGAVISEFDGELEGRAVMWRCAHLPGARADAGLLRQVWVNLISNAVKYSRPRDPAEIEIGFDERAEETVFFVRDNGVGFDPNKADKLFGVFQRLHHQNDFEGTGIGLANVRRIVMRHGGKAWAETRPGQGATFFFTLPRLEDFP